MFDIGFSELFLIGIVALIVLGPERLPKAARFVGLWVRRARAQWYSVKSELEHELADDELRRSLRATHDDLRAAQDELRAHGDAMRAQVSAAGDGARALDDELRGPFDAVARDLRDATVMTGPFAQPAATTSTSSGDVFDGQHPTAAADDAAALQSDETAEPGVDHVRSPREHAPRLAADPQHPRLPDTDAGR